MIEAKKQSTPRITVLPATRNRFTAMPIVSTRKRRVAAYARVSTDTEEQMTSYVAQVSYYTEYIQNNADWEFVDVYTDEGITGTNTKKREGFNQMITDALSGKIDLIVTKSVSRFARNTVDTLTTVRKLKERGVEVYFEKENLFSLDPKVEVILTIMSSLAQEESRSISENVTWGQRKRFADGKVSMPYKRFLGYRKGENGEPEIVPEEAEVVRLIYRLCLEGKTPHGIKSHLESSEIPSPSGKKTWPTSTIISILTNEKYKGDALLQKTFCTDFITKKMKVNEGEVPQYYVENSHPAIISNDLFEQVKQELARRKASGRQHRGTSCFAGRLVCGCCGDFYGSKVWHSNDKYRSVIWRCNLKYKGADKCNTPNIREEELEQRFVQAYNQLLKNRDSILEDCQAIIKILGNTDEKAEHIKTLEAEMDIVQNLIGQGIMQNATVAQDQLQYQANYDTLARRYQMAAERLEQLQDELEKQTSRRLALERFIQDIRTCDIMVEFSPVLWNALIDRALVQQNGELEFFFKNGTCITV